MQSARPAQALFESSHFAVVALVIIAKKVQQPVQGKHPKFRGQAVPRRIGLTACNTKGDHDIAELAWLIRREREDIGRNVFAAIAAIQLAKNLPNSIPVP